eukprot:2056138-Rhodomonas_salina.1
MPFEPASSSNETVPQPLAGSEPDFHALACPRGEVDTGSANDKKLAFDRICLQCLWTRPIDLPLSASFPPLYTL